MHGIRDCRVNVRRLTAEEIVSLTSVKKNRLARGSLKSVRFHVPWLPTTLNTKPSVINSKEVAGKRSRAQSLHERPLNDEKYGAAMDGEHLHVNSKAMPEKIPVKSLRCRKRSSSVLEERPKPTNEDFHSELMQKLNTPNKSLLPVDRRSFPNAKPAPLPEWKIFFNEFQKKAAERKNQQNA